MTTNRGASIARLTDDTEGFKKPGQDIRALEAPGNRPATYPPAVTTPDLMVMERIDRLETRITHALGDLERRLSEASANGQIELRLKMEVWNFAEPQSAYLQLLLSKALHDHGYMRCI